MTLIHTCFNRLVSSSAKKIGHRWVSSTTSDNSRKVCVVGGGPAGFYVTQYLVKNSENVKVDIVEKLPVPFGLVRFGVAPDHPEVKNVDNTFRKTAQHPRVNFLGNVAFGRDLHLKDLQELYDAVIFSYGASEDRKLAIPGEDLKNVIPARSFVGFYNGLPENRDLEVDLSNEDVAIIGVGNVALDVARMLLTPIDDLKKTDITESAIETLSQSKVKRVHIIGRRGPLQVSFTIKELREMVNLKDCRPILEPKDFQFIKPVVSQLPRPRKRLTELLLKTATDNPSEKQLKLWGNNPSKSWYLRLLRSPIKVLGNESGSVSGLVLGINKLIGDEISESQKVESTSETETLNCGLVLTSVGYKSIAEGTELAEYFDFSRGALKNTDGQVKGAKGVYCAGWLATGPRGVIVDTMTESFKVGAKVLHDLTANSDVFGLADKEGFQGLNRLLRDRGIDAVSFDGWIKIDAEERRRGEKMGKPREKITQVDELLSYSK